MQKLTYSRQSVFKTCRKRHWFSYEMRIRPCQDAKALRMGKVYHGALEHIAIDGSIEAAVEYIREAYQYCPESFEVHDWVYERETVVRLACGYQWRWSEDGLQHVATEKGFDLPLENPATGKPTTVFRLAGKIDGIAQLEDGRMAVIEHKLLGESLDSDAPLWRRLKIDHQLSFYVIAARRLGFDVSTVLYDVTRKPTIKPADVPLTDSDGLKIVTDRNNVRVFNANGKPRQTGDKEKGYTLNTRAMSREEWGEKLNEDIGNRPDYYYARVEIPRLDDELEECQQEIWEIQQIIREAQKSNRWFRTVGRDSCPFCPYEGLCTSGFNPSVDVLPQEFEIVDDPHPELLQEADA